MKIQRCILLFFLLLPLLAEAASFKVNPLKLTFSPQSRSAVLDVVNTSDRKISVQVDARSWGQDSSGKDIYQYTEDLVYFPKIVTLSPGEKRVVRLAFRGERNQQHEQSYRLFIEELVDRSQESTALSFALRFSIPVFVQSKGMKATISVAEAGVDDGVANITLSNTGTEHVMVKHLHLTGLNEQQKALFHKQEKGWYVLPGVKNQFQLALSDQHCQQANSLELAARTSVKTVVTRIEKDQIRCR